MNSKCFVFGRSYKIVNVLSVVCLIGVIFSIAPSYGVEKDTKELSKEAKDERYQNIGLFQKVLFFIEQNYVEEVDNKELVYGAIKGMMDTLDPHSNFLPPDIFRDMKQDTSGKFGGLGIEIGLRDSILTVISPIDDTPAFHVGIKPGDKIININGESTKGMNLEEAVSRMRGKQGTSVRLTIWREGFKKPQEFKIKRAEIKLATVKSEKLEPGYLYVRLTSFNENSTREMRKAMDKFEKNQKDKHIHGLVFDLRNNPGGLLEQSVDVTSLFLDEGIVVSTKGRGGRENKDMYAKKGMARKDFPVAVLVNGASASASEIVSGALQDHKRAVIMGEPTFGKGSVQNVVELQEDVGLKLTIARYYTPSGRSIQLKGIQPDILLPNLDQSVLAAAQKKGSYLRERDLKNPIQASGKRREEFSPEEYMGHMDQKEAAEKIQKAAEPTAKKYVAKEDYQVIEALNYLKGYQIFKAADLKRTDSLKGVKTSAK